METGPSDFDFQWLLLSPEETCRADADVTRQLTKAWRNHNPLVFPMSHRRVPGRV